MSYLDLPRIHFGGLFFTGPNTINNITPNYEASTKLEGPNHQYIPSTSRRWRGGMRWGWRSGGWRSARC